MRVLVFGDSITQGYWDTDGGWVEKIRKHYDTLQASDLDGRDEPTVFNLGISADNSKNVLDRIESETIARTRHGNLPVIVIQIGVNDSSTDELPEGESVSLPIEKYEQNLKMIIDKVKPISSKIIFVGLSACDETKTTPVSWGSFHYTNEAIKNYENKIKEIAEESSVAFIPVFDRFKAEIDKGVDLLPDGLHPNNDGHTFMAELILGELDSLLV
jgi:lysophospholipase L1-like esterase